MRNPVIDLRQIEEMPLRSRKKEGKYDSILNSFILSREPNVEVCIKGKSAGHLKEQLDKRIEERYLEDILETSIVDDVLHLRK